MKITVKKLLGLEVYRDTNLLAGKNGLYNEVKGITIIEDLTIGKWLKGNEALITSLGFLENATESEKNEFYNDLLNENVSAIIVKVGKFVDNIPEDLLRWGDKNNIPIIESPVYKLYTDMMYPVMADIMNTQLNKLEYFKKIHDKFISMFMERSSTEIVLKELSQIIGNPVVLVDSNHNLICSSEDIEANLNLQDVKLIQNNNTNINYYDKKIDINEKIIDEKIIEIQGAIDTKSYLHIIECNRYIDDMDFIAIESVCTNLALKMITDFAIKEVEEKFMKDLINDLSLGNLSNEKILKERANIAGINLKSSYVAIAVNLECKVKNIKNLEEQLNRCLGEYSIKYCINGNSSVIILLQINKDSNFKKELRAVKKILNSIKVKLKNEIDNMNFSIGIGSVAKDYNSISKSYTEAVDALELGESIYGDGIIVSYEELGIYKLLRNFPDKDILEEYIPASIKTLVDYDKNKNLELYKTLETYLKNNKHIKLTAEELFIHPKTVSYRIEQIKEITQIDFNDSDEIIEIQLAFKILKFVNKDI